MVSLHPQLSSVPLSALASTDLVSSTTVCPGAYGAAKAAVEVARLEPRVLELAVVGQGDGVGLQQVDPAGAEAGTGRG